MLNLPVTHSLIHLSPKGVTQLFPSTIYIPWVVQVKSAVKSASYLSSIVKELWPISNCSWWQKTAVHNYTNRWITRTSLASLIVKSWREASFKTSSSYVMFKASVFSSASLWSLQVTLPSRLFMGLANSVLVRSAVRRGPVNTLTESLVRFSSTAHYAGSHKGKLWKAAPTSERVMGER